MTDYSEWCDILFKVDPHITVEDFWRGMRQLDDLCDVDLELNLLEIEYGPNQEVWGSVEGDMPNTKEHWDRLVQTIPDIQGFEIDYDGMLEEGCI